MILHGAAPLEPAASWERVALSTSVGGQASTQTPRTRRDESDVCGPLMGEKPEQALTSWTSNLGQPGDINPGIWD